MRVYWYKHKQRGSLKLQNDWEFKEENDISNNVTNHRSRKPIKITNALGCGGDIKSITSNNQIVHPIQFFPHTKK